MALKRAWCIYEIYTTKAEHTPLIISLPKAERARFTDALEGGTFDFNAWVSSIDIEKAEAESEDDRKSIMRLVTASHGGAAALNRSVIGALREWLLEQARELLKSVPHQDRAFSTAVERVTELIWRQGKLAEAAPLFKEIVEGRGQAFFSALHKYGRFERTAGRLQEATTSLETAVKGRTQYLGKDHADTKATMRALAESWRVGGEPEKAEAALRSLIASRPSTGVSDDVPGEQPAGAEGDGGAAEKEAREQTDTYKLIISLLDQCPPDRSKASTKQHKLLEAASLAQALLRTRLANLGDQHPHYIDALILKCFFFTRLDWELTQAELGGWGRPEAEETLQRALESLRARLGSVHEKTLRCISMLAKLLHAMDRPGEAHRLSEEALAGYRSTLGEDHPDTILMVKTHREIAAGAVQKPDRVEDELDEAQRVRREEEEAAAKALAKQQELEEMMDRYGELAQTQSSPPTHSSNNTTAHYSISTRLALLLRHPPNRLTIPTCPVPAQQDASTQRRAFYWPAELASMPLTFWWAISWRRQAIVPSKCWLTRSSLPHSMCWCGWARTYGSRLCTACARRRLVGSSR